jgi:hypothetical protein
VQSHLRAYQLSLLWEYVGALRYLSDIDKHYSISPQARTYTTSPPRQPPPRQPPTPVISPSEAAAARAHQRAAKVYLIDGTPLVSTDHENHTQDF